MKHSRKVNHITVTVNGKAISLSPFATKLMPDTGFLRSQSFLWKVESFPPGDNFRVGPIIRPYRWTARNDYIILSDSSFLSVGGGYVLLRISYLLHVAVWLRANDHLFLF